MYFSEKHTHNMLILQQNVKSMQRNMHLTMGNMAMAPGGQPDAAALQQLGTMFPFDPMGIVGQMEAVSQQQVKAFTTCCPLSFCANWWINCLTVREE